MKLITKGLNNDSPLPILRPERDATVVRKARTASSEKQKVTLSCEQCRQRKTRCDKSHPCSACRRSHLECTTVRRCRLPRGRAGTDNPKDADLRDRIARLENLLADLQSTSGPRGVQFECINQKASAVIIENSRRANNERSNCSLWAALNDQVAGIRETLEEFPDDESDDLYPSPLPSAANDSSTHDFDMVLFGASSCVINPTLLEAPPKSVLTPLLDIYIYRVDSVLKVSHVPSLRNLVLPEDQALAGSLGGPSREALKFAVCFTAVCTLTEAESQDMFMEEKAKTINKLRVATEVMLSRANLLTTSDITVLQAFVVYLAGRRTCTGYRKIWALIASAVRIGQSLGLDTEEGRSRTLFQMEIRRRVWYSIGILDMQAAFDGGSHCVIASNGSLGRPPLNINDSAISPASPQSAYVEQSGLTDMSCNCMMHEAIICWRRLTHVPTDFEGQPVRIRQEWSHRSKIVREWEQRVHDKYLRYCDSAQPFQRFIKFVGQEMIISMRLLERRPIHRLFSAGPPPADGFNVLEVATEVVERSVFKFTDPGLAPWSWFAWVKWHVLAVVLAELCGNASGELVDRAWRAAEEAFPKFAVLAIDDVLWRSVEKLMRKARSARDGSAGSSLPNPATSEYRNVDAGRLDNKETRGQDNGWTLHSDVRAHGPTPQSSHKLEPSTETGESNTSQLPADVGNSAPEASVDESEYMSWVNWELFVQDVGNVDEQYTLENSFASSYGTD